MYLLDTDHCVFLLRKDQSVKRRLRARRREEAFVSIVSVCELYFGAFWSKRPEENLAEVRRLVGRLRVLPLTDATAERFGRLKAELWRAGQKLDDPDLLIAATALDHELTLVTHNKAHYQRIPGLRLDDWHSD